MVMAGGWAGSVGATPVEPPLRVAFSLDDGSRVMGWVTSFDDEGFALRDRDDNQRRLAWDRLPPDRVLWVHERLLERDDAEAWFDLAVRLMADDAGRRSGEAALRAAVRAEPGLADKADRLRAGDAVTYHDPPAEAAETGGADTGSGEPITGGGNPGNSGGPITTGSLQAEFWGELSDELMASSVEQLKQEGLEAQRLLGVPLTLYEDANFLVYTDLAPGEARRWVGLLDNMYDRLLDMFSLPRDTHVFRGKCAIYIFQYEADYRRYWQLVHQYDARGTAGLCLSKGDGFSIASFYRQPNVLNFAHILVHETVHAFVHRYRSYPFVVSWINEGIAEYIAHELVDNAGMGRSDWASDASDARNALQRVGSLGGMLDLGHIQAWQYPVAYQLAAFMIRQSPNRYEAFINAIKDGKEWPVALREDYGVDRDQLVEAFGQSLRIRDLQP
jgi:hypothetical protein